MDRVLSFVKKMGIPKREEKHFCPGIHFLFYFPFLFLLGITFFYRKMDTEEWEREGLFNSFFPSNNYHSLILL